MNVVYIGVTNDRFIYGNIYNVDSENSVIYHVINPNHPRFTMALYKEFTISIDKWRELRINKILEE